ncbi:MAG: response regulator [bacterium]
MKEETKKKVLVIEDETALLFAIRAELSYAGYEVLAASTGEEGLKMFQDKKPDLVVLDLILPGIDGFEILSEIKKDSGKKMIPVLVVSNLGDKNDIERAKSLGAYDYLVKANYSLESIQEKIKEALKSA